MILVGGEDLEKALSFSKILKILSFKNSYFQNL